MAEVHPAFRAYPDEAKRLAWRLYRDHRSHKQIVAALQSQWPRFSHSTLQRWIKDGGWPERRAAMDRAELLTESTVDKIVAELTEDLDGVREVLSEELKKQAKAGKVNPQTAYAYSNVVKKLLDEVRRHEKEFDYLGRWTRFFTDLVDYLMGKDEELARSLDAHLDGFKEFVLETYGA